MKLSIVIVNYNVSHFLEQCLNAVQKATEKIQAEIWVVDNASSDGSVKMVKQNFPEVNVIANSNNVGFSKANNQAIEQSSGEYVLLLNPDTVVKEDTFEKCVAFMDAHPKAGALGIKMIDGKGNFLPESKRSLPTPKVAFYKIFGLSSLFPKSKTFGRYHLGHLSKDENHEVEILSGAYMFMRKSVLGEVGVLDETYFMYGEDIDLSFRITQAGYKNYYFSDSSIIHYKGESTKKGSINYVMVFYRAMIIFAKKHFSAQYARFFGFFINLAVYFRAFLAIAQRVLQNLFVPVLDGILIATAFYWVQKGYADYSGKIFPSELIRTALAVIPFLWVASIFFSGGYDKPFKSKYIQRGNLAASFVLLALYALLSEEYRFSRMVLVLTVTAGLFLVSLLRTVLNLLPFPSYHLFKKKAKRFGIVGSYKEANRVKEILQKSGLKMDAVFFISPNEKRPEGKGYIGSLPEVVMAIQSFSVDQLVFCAQDVPYSQIIDTMEKVTAAGVAIRIAPPNASFVIGSDSINASGEYYSLLNVNTISKQTNKRNKRMCDLFFGVVFLFLAPLLMWFQSNKMQLWANTWAVIMGRMTWVGFCESEGSQVILPNLKKGVLCPADRYEKPIVFSKELETLNIDYAKHYSVLIDVKIILKNLSKLGS